MEIRLRGTPAETADAVEALRRVLALASISQPYPDRPPSTLHRVYITATPKGTRQ